MAIFGGRYIFDQKTIDEIRRLRMSDKETWTMRKLAERFETTHGNICKIVNRRNRKERIDINKDGVNLRDESRL